MNVAEQREYDNTLGPHEGIWLPDGGSVLHIRSKNRILVYELRPNAKVGDLIKINSAGFRDREFTEEKEKDTFRIIVIGDSISFGWGLKIEDTFPKQLENLLNKKQKDKIKYEVLNFSVGGYNSLQEAELLRAKVLKYNPDLVIIGFCTNDFFIGMDAGLWWHFYKGKSPLFSFIKLLLVNYKYIFDPIRLGKDAYSQISKISKEHNLKTIVCLIPSLESDGDLYLPPGFKEFLTSIDIQFIDMSECFLQFNDRKEFYTDGLHLSIKGHAIVAEKIHEYLNMHANIILSNQ